MQIRQEVEYGKNGSDWNTGFWQINGKKVIIFLDEYDTPMQEAYIGGY